jgi:hypothetical protein
MMGTKGSMAGWIGFAVAQLGFLGNSQYPLWALTALALNVVVLYALTARWQVRCRRCHGRNRNPLVGSGFLGGECPFRVPRSGVRGSPRVSLSQAVFAGGLGLSTRQKPAE